jgi:hypothetical protein
MGQDKAKTGQGLNIQAKLTTRLNPFLERRRKMVKEYKEFAMRGNVADTAVGIIIGAAFGTIVKSLVSDVLMPPIGLLLGDVDFTGRGRRKIQDTKKQSAK